MITMYYKCNNFLDPAQHDNMSPLGSPIVLQRKGSVYGANVPMITELVNDSNVQFLGKLLFKKIYILEESVFYI